MTTSRRINRTEAITHIETVRTAITAADEADPRTVIFAMMAAEAPDFLPDPEPFHPDLNALFSVINGARYGGITVYCSSDIRHDPYAEYLDGGEDRWQSVGDIAQVPVFLSRTDGGIWHALEASDESWMDSPMTQIADDIFSFVAWYAMGPGYCEIFKSDTDLWIAFLREHGFLDWEDPE